METSPLEGIPRYLAPSVALFEAVDDELLPLKPLGIQVRQRPPVARLLCFLLFELSFIHVSFRFAQSMRANLL